MSTMTSIGPAGTRVAGAHSPSTTRGRKIERTTKNPKTRPTASDPQSSPSIGSPVLSTPQHPLMSMTSPTKNVVGITKNSSISQICTSCGMRDPILSNARTPLQMNRSTRMAAP
ncbi:hypothetical protein ABIE44_001565 [Marmoricola sp. OAE513]|uniref:hypothetical protein n=1 Tax=Marmoricola sp. OAE513 TaxID=2817894 RepID=UPI003392A429